MPANDTKIRLQVYLARCGVASRRAAEDIIAQGRVSVNGAIETTPGTKVALTDRVCVDGKKLALESRHRYVLLNKPVGVVCSSNDEQNRAVAVDLLKDAYSERLYSVGRLDMYSSGALLFTNDGAFAAKVSHPSAQIEKEYELECTQDIPDTLVKDFLKGITIEGIRYRCAKAKKISARKMRIVLIEGKNREIRRVFAAYDLPIKYLTRIRIGQLKLGKLKRGEFRDLSAKEINNLLKTT